MAPRLRLAEICRWGRLTPYATFATVRALAQHGCWHDSCLVEKPPIPQAGHPPQVPRHTAATAAAGPVATRWRRHHGCDRPHLSGCRWAAPSAGRRGGRREIAGCRDDRQAWALAREGGVRCGQHGRHDGCNQRRRSGSRHGSGIDGEGAARRSTHRTRHCQGGAWRPCRPSHLSWPNLTPSGSSAAIGFRGLRVCNVDVVHTHR
jgi:hypothetical protein